MQTGETEIEINASSEEVWNVLTDFESDPDWNPFITNAEGTLAPERRLTENQPPRKTPVNDSASDEPAA